MCRWSGSYSTAIGRGSPVESMCRTMLRIGAIPVSPARNVTGRLSPSGRRKSPYGPSTVTVAPASSFFSAMPPFPGPTRTQSCTARGRSGAEAIVYARDPLGEAEVHPLARLEAEGVVGKGDGDLEDARRELLDLGHDGGV